MSVVVPKLHYRVRVQSTFGASKFILSLSSLTRSARQTSFASFTGLKKKSQFLIDRVPKKCAIKDSVSKDLEVLWDDGYGNKTVKDYLEAARDIIKPDSGPPWWFCPVECGQPLNNSPVLLFLPGFDGVGLGLTLHHKPLGKVFEVQCLHIPIYDRTPFEGLVELVEESVKNEHASSPNKPIYLVGESLGGCLALAIAARNPDIDLVLILVNPGTSFCTSQLPLLIPVFECLPEGLCNAVLPYLLGSLMGNPLKMAMADIEFRLPPGFKIERLLANLIEFQTYIPDVLNIIPKETFVWKLKFLNAASAFANSHLHAVKAEVLVIASGNNCVVPSRDEAKRLQSSLQNCTVRYFKDNGHTLLLEEGVSLLTIIKATGKYRRSRRHDFVSDFVPPSMSEFKCFFDQVTGFLRLAGSSAIFSTMADGRVVRGLSGIPDEGPVILVGNHMLMGVEPYSLLEEFLRQKNYLIHAVAHPVLFNGTLEKLTDDLSLGDWLRVMGAVPVTPVNLFKLLSTKKNVAIYPGGAREALHNKGEEYNLIWPDEPEFVRMAARFGATIVPFGSVGEDDIMNLHLDYNDLMKIPLVNDFIRDFNVKAARVRDKNDGDVANEEVLYLPGISPKTPPGRIYSLFGKPIETKGKKELIMKDKEYAKGMYLQIQNEVRSIIDYLLKKRDEDPCRNIFDRTLYRSLYSSLSDISSFDP